MSFFGWRRKSLNISEEDPVYKVRYLGNIHTCMMKGEGCVDKPASVLWNNYLQSSHQALDMKIVVSVSGIKAFTKEQGLMQYWSHKISYIIAHPQYPRMFLWVYRHEGRKMKLDLRCHAVLCKNETKAKLLSVQLHDKLSFALKEFVRDKRRKHSSRIIYEKTNSELSNGSILPLRQQMLSQGGKFKPPVSKMNSAPKLGSIYELDEKEEEKRKEFDEVEEEEERVEARQLISTNMRLNPREDIKEVECEEEDEEEGLGGMNDSIDDEDDDGNDADDDLCTESDVSDGIDYLTLDPESDNNSVSSDHVCKTDVLKCDDMDFLMSKQKKTDSDGESSESGFSDSSKEIGLYRVDDGERLNEGIDDIELGSNTGRITQCDTVSNCHNNSFDDEDDEVKRSNNINSNSIISSSNNINNNSNNNTHITNNSLDSSKKQHIHTENTTTSLKKINKSNNQIISQGKNNDNNNNNSTFITESSYTTSSSKSSSSSPSTESSLIYYNSSSNSSSTVTPSSSLPSQLVSTSRTEGTSAVQYL